MRVKSAEPHAPCLRQLPVLVLPVLVALLVAPVFVLLIIIIIISEFIIVKLRVETNQTLMFIR